MDITGDVTGNADSASALQTARNIGGVSFDGSADINLPGVNAEGNQNTTGTSAGLTGTPDITVGDVTSANINATGVVTATSFSGDGSGLTGVASTDNIQTATPANFLKHCQNYWYYNSWSCNRRHIRLCNKHLWNS